MQHWIPYVLIALSIIFGLGAHFAARKSGQDERKYLLALILAALAVWAACNAVSMMAPDEETALIWRKNAVLGWGTVFSFLLHFSWMSADPDVLKRYPALHLIIYVPAALNILFFLAIPGIADAQYQLVLVDGVWVNQWVDTAINWYSLAQYLLFFLASIYLLCRWLKKTRGTEAGRHIALLIVAMAVAVVLSLAFNNAFMRSSVGSMLTQVIVIIAVVPAFMVYRMMDRVDFMPALPMGTARPVSEILSSTARTRTYRTAGMILFFLSYLSFYTGSLSIPFFVLSTTRLGNILLGLILMTAAQLVYSMDRLKLSVKQQENLLLFIFIVVDLILFIRFAAEGAVTSWSSIMLIILTGVIFSNISLVMAGGAVHVLLMTLSAVFYTDVQTSINMEDHIWRILIVISAMALAYVINRIYKRNLHDNEAYANLNHTISQISQVLAVGSLGDYQQKALQAIDIAREFLQPDHLFILEEEDGPEHFPLTQARPLPSLMLQENRELTNQLTFLLKDPDLQTAQGELCYLMQENAPYNDQLSQVMQKVGADQMLLVRILANDKARCLVLLTRREGVKPALYLRNQEFFVTVTNILTGFIRRGHQEARLEYLAYHDTLTGLIKRDQFIKLVEQRLRERREHQVCGVVFLDLDGFKQVNDEAGHAAGDEVLQEVSRRLKSTALREDVVGRFGGDEFLLFILRDSNAAVVEWAARFQHALEMSIERNGKLFDISASMGVATGDARVCYIQMLIDEADQAMYADKTSKHKEKQR